MAHYDRMSQKNAHTRAIELLKKGLNARQIADRTGMTPRSVLRIKQQELEKSGGKS